MFGSLKLKNLAVPYKLDFLSRLIEETRMRVTDSGSARIDKILSSQSTLVEGINAPLKHVFLSSILVMSSKRIRDIANPR